MSEKTEKATTYKLQKAKEKGQVAKSSELTNYLALLVMTGAVAVLWPKQLQQIKSFLSYLLLNSAHFQFSVDTLCQLQNQILNQLISWWLPLSLISIITVVLATVAQTGFVWSPKVIAPDFKRLHWGQGLKKLCSLKTCFEALKSFLKLFFASLVLFFVIKPQLVTIFQLSLTPPSQHPYVLMHFLLTLMFDLLVVLALIAFADKYFTNIKFNKDQRMTKQEVKDEYRQREGDPKIKSKIKQLQQQLRQKTASLQNVKNADVLITNPTHLAIALKYDGASMPAPKVVCKAEGELALQVKKLASKYNIPLIENKSFARALYHSVQLNQFISEDLYPVAAGIFKTIYQQRAV